MTNAAFTLRLKSRVLVALIFKNLRLISENLSQKMFFVGVFLVFLLYDQLINKSTSLIPSPSYRGYLPLSLLFLLSSTNIAIIHDVFDIKKIP